MGVHAARRRGHHAPAPHRFLNVFARQQPPDVLEQKPGKLELFLGQVNRGAGERRGIVAAVQPELIDFERAGILLRVPGFFM